MPKLSRAEWLAIIAIVLVLVVLGVLLRPRAAPVVVAGNCPSGTGNGTVADGVPFRMYWCQPEVDHLEGAKITSGLPNVPVQLDNVRIERGPFTDNLVQWSGLVPAQPRGNYTITLAAQNFKVVGDPNTVQAGPDSSPFVLGVGSPPAPPSAPNAPVRLRLDLGPVTQTVAPPTTNRRP